MNKFIGAITLGSLLVAAFFYMRHDQLFETKFGHESRWEIDTGEEARQPGWHEEYAPIILTIIADGNNLSSKSGRFNATYKADGKHHFIKIKQLKIDNIDLKDFELDEYKEGSPAYGSTITVLKGFTPKGFLTLRRIK